MSEKNIRSAWIMKAGLRTVSKLGAMQRNGLGPRQFGIHDHKPHTALGGSFGKEKMTAIIGPARLHSMISTTGQSPAFTGIETVFVNLKASAYGCGKGNPRRICRIPTCFRAVRTHIGGNSRQDP
jgi:hypothetical protein